jgi:hypothetical protein
MNKLPFTWELEYKGIISHAIGSPHWLRMVSASRYTQDILHKLEGKSTILLEANTQKNEVLEIAVADIALSQGLQLKTIATEQERNAFDSYYSSSAMNTEAASAYIKEDSEQLKKMYGRPDFKLSKITDNIAERSQEWIKTTPALLVTNLAHFLIVPSLIKIYEKNGIKAKRVQ